MQSWTKLVRKNTKCGSMKVITLRNYCDSTNIVSPVVTRLLDRCAKPLIQRSPQELAKKLANDVLSHNNSNNSAPAIAVERPKIEEIFKTQKAFDFDAQFTRCNFELVETIPTGLKFPGTEHHTSTFDAWLCLLKNAEKSIDIAAFYWSLLDKTGYETSWRGGEIFNAIVAAAERGVKIRIAQHAPDKKFQQEESAELASRGLAEVRSLNFALYGKGVLHTKMWVVDNEHIFLGSANMDWRSLTEVKELGIVVRNNAEVALDLGKIFSVYWEMGARSSPLNKWWRELETNYNENTPLRLLCSMDGKPKSENIEVENISREVSNVFDYQSEDYSAETCKANVFISSCPAELNPEGREHDLGIK